VNINRARGTALLAFGKLQERLGRLLRRPQYQFKGFERQVIGRSRLAMADVQDVVKSCVQASAAAAELSARKNQPEVPDRNGKQPLDAA
jgi:uncharacterized protein YjbJ (UPF0337 family)